MTMADRDKHFHYNFIITIFLIILTIVSAVKLNDEQMKIIKNYSNNEEISKTVTHPEPRALFSPRVDYNEWMPVGRGDPLKNDPTYDYSPPVLDRVRYWGDNTNKDKNEILLLGVPSKRQSHTKDSKFNNSIRRNYYPNLPTRLMPPPMQTISPPTTKHTTSVDISTMNTYDQYKTFTHGTTHHNWHHNGIPSVDGQADESINYVSLVHPGNSVGNAPGNAYSGKTNFKSQPSYEPQHTYVPSFAPTISHMRKPWLHELLQKEVANPSQDFVMHASHNVYESHTAESIGPMIWAPTTESPPQPTFFQPTTIPPAPIITTEPLFVHKILPTQPAKGPLYLIIEGHSKVKTYGLKDNETSTQHQPKIVPVATTENVVVQHVVNHDETGKILEVSHLTTVPPTKSFKQKTSPKINNHDNFVEISKQNPPERKEIQSKDEKLPSFNAEPSSGMGNLLSFLDKTLGNYFLTNDQPNEPTTKTKEATTDPTSTRTVRQVFDYDQLLPDGEHKRIFDDYMETDFTTAQSL